MIARAIGPGCQMDDPVFPKERLAEDKSVDQCFNATFSDQALNGNIRFIQYACYRERAMQTAVYVGRTLNLDPRPM